MVDPQMSFTVYREPGEIRLAVSGDLDLASAPAFVDQAQALIAESPDRLVIDFGGVGFCDSAGIRGLLAIRAAAQRTGCEVRLCGVREPHVRWVLHVTALDTVIPVAEPYEPSGADGPQAG